MAATQNIGLRITIGGVTESISNIKQLEDAITKARDKLSGLSIGSDEFRKLTNEIRTAQSSLKDLNKAAEGLEFDQKLEAFARVGGAITSSFAAAQAAVTLFGGDSEKVAEAATKAQNLLTIALTARSVAEGVAGLRTVALTIATKASTLATNASTAATRVLYTTIAANPIGALVAVIGLAVGALIAFGSSSEEAADSQEELEKRLKLTNDKFNQQTTLLEIQGEKSSNLQRIKVQQAQENLEILQKQFVREQINNRNSEETAKLREQVINQENVLILEKARLEKTINDETSAAEQKLADNRKKNFENEKSRISALIQVRLLELKGIESIQKKVAQLTKDESEIEEQLKKNVAMAEQYAKALDSLNTFGMEYGQLQGNLIELSDDFYNVFDQLRLSAEGYFNSLSEGSMDLKNVQKGFTDFKNTIIETNKTLLSPNELQLLTDYSQGYSTLYGVLSEYQNPPFDIKEYEQLLVDLSIAQGKIDIDPFGRTPEQIAKVKVNINEFFKEIETEFLDAYEKLKLPSILQGITDPEAQKAARDGLRETGKLVFQNLVEAGQQILVFEDGSESTNLSVQKLNKELLKLADTAREGFVLENITKLRDQFNIPLKSIEKNREMLLDLENEINTKRFDQQNKYYTDVEFLEYELAQEGIDISKFSYETKLKILKEFLEKEVIATETAEGRKRKAQEDTISGISATIQEFQSVLNSLAQTTSQYYAFQLDLLAKQSEDAQDKIVGDSKESVELRLEQEKIFNEKRKQLEKQAAITSLRISFAQSLANTAEAITKAFAGGPVVGVIAAGIIASLSAAQTALIGSQIGQIQSLQRGGMIKGQGGLVVGPSHEYGGVKFQGGGIELEGGEAVINRRSSIQYGGLLNQINQVGGGKPLTSNTFDDSRIVEAISKQRQEPIRAYVVEQDISNKQGVSRRLEQLSQI
jgi:hypothetical protein